jgi:hypothetical protein
MPIMIATKSTPATFAHISSLVRKTPLMFGESYA